MRPNINERKVTVGLISRDRMRLTAMFWHFDTTKVVRHSDYYHLTESSFERLMRVSGARLFPARPGNVQIAAGSGGLDHLSVDITVRGRLDRGLS